MKAKVDRIPCDYEYRCSECGSVLNEPEKQLYSEYARSVEIITYAQKYCQNCGAELEWNLIDEKALKGFFAKDLIPIGEQVAKGFEEGISKFDKTMQECVKPLEEMAKKFSKETI